MDGSRQGNQRRVGAARRRSRGHGPARLDGTRPRATVADKVMKSGKTAGHGNGLPLALTARQAKRAGPKLEAGPEASAERSEGTMEARKGRDAAGGSMRYAHDSATGHLPGGRGRPAVWASRNLSLVDFSRTMWVRPCPPELRAAQSRLRSAFPRISCHHHAISPGRRPSNRSIGLR